jgi:hypothetical protein
VPERIIFETLSETFAMALKTVLTGPKVEPGRDKFLVWDIWRRV